MRQWNGSPPTVCDLCDHALTSEFVDGRTKAGPWGMLCMRCHKKHGVGLGTGNGQHYRKAGDRWVNASDGLQEPLVVTDKPKGLTEKEEARLRKLAEPFNHQPREPQGVEGEDDVPYIPE